MLLQIASSVLIDSNRRAMSVSFREWLDRSGFIGSASTIIREVDAWVASLLAWLALRQFGLSTVFVVAFISATLLPLGSEPAAFLVKLNPELFWPAIVVATARNTLGGALTWWMGYRRTHLRTREPPQAARRARPALAALLRSEGMPVVVVADRR